MINKIIKKFFYTLIKVSNTRGHRAKDKRKKKKDKRQKYNYIGFQVPRPWERELGIGN